MTNNTEHWEIGLEPWVLEDGNYPDFYVGQSTEFALSFYPKDTPSVAKAPKFARIGDHPGRYEIVSEVVYLGGEAWVVDFGLLAYENSKPPSLAKVGGYVEMAVNVFVDPFFYFENLVNDPLMPAMIYSWRIDGIQIVSYPLIQHPSGAYCPIEEKATFKQLRSTAEPREGDFTEISHYYVFSCSLIDTEPRRKLGSR